MLQDRRIHPIFIHSIVDDMVSISPNAMRVYMHLARRANNKDGSAWPSYQSVGDHCFISVYKHPDTRRKYAIESVDELIKAGLIEKTQRIGRKGQETNVYTLVDPSPQSPPAVTVESPPAVTVESPPAVTVESPKDTPIEDTPIEDTPPSSSSTRSARGRKKKAAPPHPMTDAIKDAYVKAVGHKLPPSAFRTISPDAKFAAQQGVTPQEVEYAYGILQSESFWKGKTIPLGKVLEAVANRKETMRNRKGANDGQATNGADWHPDEVTRIQELKRAGDTEGETAAILAAVARMRALQ